MLLIPGCIDQGEGPLLEQLPQLFDSRGILFQLCPISSLEFVPFLEVVGVPLPQRGAGRCLLQPQVEVSALLGNAARPQPFHQDAGSVRSRGRFVNTFRLDHILLSIIRCMVLPVFSNKVCRFTAACIALVPAGRIRICGSTNARSKAFGA